jgi:hypothetical protein
MFKLITNIENYGWLWIFGSGRWPGGPSRPIPILTIIIFTCGTFFLYGKSTLLDVRNILSDFGISTSHNLLWNCGHLILSITHPTKTHLGIPYQLTEQKMKYTPKSWFLGDHNHVICRFAILSSIYFSMGFWLMAFYKQLSILKLQYTVQFLFCSNLLMAIQADYRQGHISWQSFDVV